MTLESRIIKTVQSELMRIICPSIDYTDIHWSNHVSEEQRQQFTMYSEAIDLLKEAKLL